MKSFKKVILGVKLDEGFEIVSLLNRLDFLKTSDIFLVHVSRSTDHSLFPELKLAFYPSGEEKIILEQAIIGKLNQIKNSMVSSGRSGEIQVECLFSGNPKKSFCQFASEINSDLILLMAEKSKFPIASFVQYQIDHSKIPVFILRP